MGNIIKKYINMKLTTKQLFIVIGALFYISAIILSLIYYDWMLTLIILLFVAGNNFEQAAKSK